MATFPLVARADPEAGPAADASTEVDQVIVTGGRVARTVESSPAPIDVLSEVALEKANKANLLESLNTLLPSFNLPNVATPNIGSMIRAGQLRGLNPSHTLVLVNGKRRHGTAFLGAGGFAASAPADLSLIASGAIERIEVLRDGASAIYGSDAIAGVVNIITDKSASGGELYARVGQYYEGDGLTQTFKAGAGFKLGEAGYLNIAGQLDDQELVVRNSPVPSSFLFYFPLNAAGKEVLPAGNLASSPSLPAGATPNPKEATRNNNAWINTGAAPYTTKAVTASAGLPLPQGGEAYGTATWAQRKSSAPQNFRQPVRDEVVRALYPDGFTPVEAITEQDYEVTGGLKGQAFGGWRWDLSTTYGEDDVDVYVYNSDNPTYGAASQRDFYIGNLNYAAWTSNLDVGRSFAWRVPVDLSFGLEHRREDYQLSRGDVQSYSYGGSPILDGPNAGKLLGRSLGGAQALPGFRPEDEADLSRTSNAVYADAALNVTPKWVVDVAGRYERYSDFGDTRTWRITTRYDFADWLAVRGTASTGFNAPALAAQAYKNTANMNNFINHVLQVSSPEAAALGAKPLKPETSKSYSVGLVSHPAPWLNLALDVYQIDVKDRIAQSTTVRQDSFPAYAAQIKALVSSVGFDPNDGVSYFINAADSRSRGLELTAEATTSTEAWGQFRWSAAVNRNDTKVTNIAPTPAVLAAFKVPVFSAAAQTNIRYQAPLGKEVLGLVWDIGRLSVNARATHYGKLKRNVTITTPATSGPWAGVVGEVPYDVGKLWVADIDVSFDLTERVRVAVSANNLFDQLPPQVPTPALAAYQQYSYTNNGPVGVQGGFYAASISYRW